MQIKKPLPSSCQCCITTYCGINIGTLIQEGRKIFKLARLILRRILTTLMTMWFLSSIKRRSNHLILTFEPIILLIASSQQHHHHQNTAMVMDAITAKKLLNYQEVSSKSILNSTITPLFAPGTHTHHSYQSASSYQHTTGTITLSLSQCFLQRSSDL